MFKLYAGCALTNAPDKFKRDVVELKERLKNIPDVQVLEFLGLVKGTARDVYIHDIINCVGRCDFMLAICDYPSTGLGWEMATQTQRGKPLLAFGHNSAKVTRLVLDPGLPNYKFLTYKSFDDIFETVVVGIQMTRLGIPLTA